MPPPLPEGTLLAPLVPRDNTPPLSRLITELIKVYNNQDDIKYRGEDYKTLRGKVDIYYDYCHKVRVPQESFNKGFSIMLKGKARDFYFSTIANTNYSFTTMYFMIEDHFETQEKH
jgi:hypothetical protein